jgi:general secretion pathway protein J
VQDPSTGAKSLALPAGLELTIEHDRFGTLERLFVLTDFDADKAQTDLSRTVESGSSDSATEDGASVPASGQ